MNNLGRRLLRLEAQLQPPEDKIIQHIIHFVEGDGTVTGSMVIRFDNPSAHPMVAAGSSPEVEERADKSSDNGNYREG